MNRQRCVDELLMAGCLDWVEASQLAWVAMDRGGAKSDHDIRQRSFDLIRELITGDLMEIGDVPVEKGARRLLIWSGTKDDWPARMQREWIALGRNPTLGDLGGWLQNTAKGDEIGNRLLNEQDARWRKGRR